MLQSCQATYPKQTSFAIPSTISFHDGFKRKLFCAKTTKFWEWRFRNGKDKLSPQQLRKSQEDAPQPFFPSQACHMECFASQLNN